MAYQRRCKVSLEKDAGQLDEDNIPKIRRWQVSLEGRLGKDNIPKKMVSVMRR
jgi:hypothetical protein